MKLSPEVKEAKLEVLRALWSTIQAREKEYVRRGSSFDKIAATEDRMLTIRIELMAAKIKRG